MTALKVLWLSNGTVLEDDAAGTGSWFSPLAQRLVASGRVEICNIVQRPIGDPIHQGSAPLQEWQIPRIKHSFTTAESLPKAYTDTVGNIIDQYKPDLIDVWGTENAAGLFTARHKLDMPTLLEIQGLKSAIAPTYAGGLTTREIIGCIGLKEIIRGTNILRSRAEYWRWRKYEREMVENHSAVQVQNAWTQAQVEALGKVKRMYFNSHGLLRVPFYDAQIWQRPNAPSVFTLLSYPAPFKGLHVAVRALAHLRKWLPEATLRVGGALQSAGIRQDGYIAWVNREAKRLGVADSIVWLGRLSVEQIIYETQTSGVLIFPSFSESNAITVQEAMLLGMPVVISYSGGMMWLGANEEQLLYFPTGDDVMAAHQLRRVLTDEALALKLSRNARDLSLKRNDPEWILENQLTIYEEAAQL